MLSARGFGEVRREQEVHGSLLWLYYYPRISGTLLSDSMDKGRCTLSGTKKCEAFPLFPCLVYVIKIEW